MNAVRKLPVLSDVFTPANAITVAGLVLTLVGTLRLDTFGGLSLAVIGRILDIVDGPVARRTHTSHFGALLDAGADKVSMLALLVAMFYFGLAPVGFLAFVLLYHAAILYMSLDGEKQGVDAIPTKLGKYTMFLHIAALLSFVLANVVSRYETAVLILAAVLAVAGIVAGAISLYRYVELYRKNVLSKK